MKHLFVPCKIALKLKKSGFDEPCLGYYDKEKKIRWAKHLVSGAMDFVPYQYNSMPNVIPKYKKWYDDVDCSAPIYQQVIEWFRERQGIEIKVDFFGKKNMEARVYDTKASVHDETKRWRKDTNSYYKGLNEAIETALKLI